jgi:hypothetical protein
MSDILTRMPVQLASIVAHPIAGFGFPQDPGTSVCEDKTTCIEWESHVIRVRTERAKHIDTSKHFAHETIKNRQMRLITVV